MLTCRMTTSWKDLDEDGIRTHACWAQWISSPSPCLNAIKIKTNFKIADNLIQTLLHLIFCKNIKQNNYINVT